MGTKRRMRHVREYDMSVVSLQGDSELLAMFRDDESLTCTFVPVEARINVSQVTRTRTYTSHSSPPCKTARLLTINTRLTASRLPWAMSVVWLTPDTDSSDVILERRDLTEEERIGKEIIRLTFRKYCRTHMSAYKHPPERCKPLIRRRAVHQAHC